MDPSQLVEIEAIKQLKARYFRLMDEKRWDEFADCFTEDVVVDTTQDGAPIIHGRDAFLAMLSKAIGPAVTVHHGHMPEIEITGERSATGIWSMEDYLEFPTDPPFTVHGRGHYHERYTKGDDGRWRIASLELTRLWIRHRGPMAEAVANVRSDVD